MPYLKTTAAGVAAIAAFAAANSASAAPKQPAFPHTSQGEAHGTPHRSPELPPGLQKNFERHLPGLIHAAWENEGSNSRLHDNPCSP